MDWLDAVTAALAIVAVPLALRYPLTRQASAHDDAASSAGCDCRQHEHEHEQIFPQEEEPTQSGKPIFPAHPE